MLPGSLWIPQQETWTIIYLYFSSYPKMICAVTHQCLCDRIPDRNPVLPAELQTHHLSVQHQLRPGFPVFFPYSLIRESEQHSDISSASTRWKSVPVLRSFPAHSGSGYRESADCPDQGIYSGSSGWIRQINICIHSHFRWTYYDAFTRKNIPEIL